MIRVTKDLNVEVVERGDLERIEGNLRETDENVEAESLLATTFD